MALSPPKATASTSSTFLTRFQTSSWICSAEIYVSMIRNFRMLCEDMLCLDMYRGVFFTCRRMTIEPLKAVFMSTVVSIDRYDFKSIAKRYGNSLPHRAHPESQYLSSIPECIPAQYPPQRPLRCDVQKVDIPPAQHLRWRLVLFL
jgi:hypothetical protein